MGDKSKWFSIKPKEYFFLKEKTIPEQIAGQIHFTQIEVEKQLDQIQEQRKLCVNFSDLCKDPEQAMQRVKLFIKSNYNHVEERQIKFSPLTPCLEDINADMLDKLSISLENMYRHSL